MSKVAEGIGKNYEEAVEDALNKVGLKKDQVSIEMIEEPKKRIFSILDHKQVKVRVTEIEKTEEIEVPSHEARKEPREFTEEEGNVVKERIIEFLNEYFDRLGLKLDIKTYVEKTK